MKKNSNEDAQFMSWVYKRARRSVEKIVKNFCKERQSDMAGLDTDIVRCIHSLALFEAARFINTPDCMCSDSDEVDKADRADYAVFLGKRLREHFALCDSLRNWQPESHREKVAALKADTKLASAALN